MKKINIATPFLLYKKPISNNSSLYHSLIPKSNLNRLDTKTNANIEEQNLKNDLIETVRTETNRQKFNYLYSNYNNFKKLNSKNPYLNRSRYSANNKMIKNKIKNFIDIQDNNSLFFQSKDNESKIFPNYNNTCNISLNQHFYNIDYNNFNSSNSIIKRDDIDHKIDKLRSRQKERLTPNLKINYKHKFNNDRNDKKKIYLNSFKQNFPINVIKDINHSYDSLNNHIKYVFNNNANTEKSKKTNIINLFVNPNKQFFESNKIYDLNNFTNFIKKNNKKRITENKYLVYNPKKEFFYQLNNTDNCDYKYKKKIVNHNSFTKKHLDISNSFQIKKSIPIYNYKKDIISLNKTQENLKDEDKRINLNEKKNRGNTSFTSIKIEALNLKKNINSHLNKSNYLNNKNKGNLYLFQNFSKQNNNINKGIHLNLNQIDKSKRTNTNNLSERKKLSSSISTIKTSFNKYNYISKKIKINNIMHNNKSILEKRKIPSLKINNISNSNTNSKIIHQLRKETSKESINKSNMFKIEDYTTKRINNEVPNPKAKLKRINLNKLLINRKINKKFNEMTSKGKIDIKKIFIEHFSTEGNKIINNNCLSSKGKVNLSQNNNNTNYIQVKPKKKTSKNDGIANTSLSELLRKVKKTKNTFVKKNNLNEKQSGQKNLLVNKKIVYLINQSNSQNNIKRNFKKKENSSFVKLEKYSISSEASIQKKENNEYMDQSQKLSNYIKEYYRKNNNYPQTQLDFYRIGRVIGQGGFAKVNLGLNVLTGRVVAIKSFNKNIKTKSGDKINMDKILYEINLMRKLNHENITKILETFEDEQFYFIIMEYINGGNLFSYVKKRRKLSEKVSKFIFRQIILGIQHIHSKLIVHRDIKLENILIDMNNNIKICDFGIGMILSSENEELHNHCGTPMYIAPEIILSTKERGYKGFPVDIWSAGIALYIMISGKLPFNLDESPEDLDDINNLENKERNKQLKYEILNKEPKYIENISDELRNLLKGLLNKDPKKRLNCDQILNHPWFNDINSHKVHLFSKAEKSLLTKTFIDYRKCKVEDVIENFTFSNLLKDKASCEDKYNCESKSSLLAPFNSINYDFFKIYDYSKKDMRDEFDDFHNKKLKFEKDLFSFSNKAKELNFQYELDNNKEVDNGILINNKSNTESNSSSFSNTNSKINFINEKNINLGFDKNDKTDIKLGQKAESILTQIEKLGYDREYVIKSLKNNYLNHATTIYFLLMNYTNI